MCTGQTKFKIFMEIQVTNSSVDNQLIKISFARPKVANPKTTPNFRSVWSMNKVKY